MKTRADATGGDGAARGGAAPLPERAGSSSGGVRRRTPAASGGAEAAAPAAASGLADAAGKGRTTRFDRDSVLRGASGSGSPPGAQEEGRRQSPGTGGAGGGAAGK